MSKCKNFIILGTLIMLFVSSNLIGMQFELDEFRRLRADFKAEMEPITDMDMNYCSVLKVEIDKPVDISIKQKVYRKERIDEDEYYFYVSSREDEITFSAAHYVPFTMDVKNELKIGTTYYVKLNTIKDVDVTINVVPKDASIMVNGLKWEKSQGRLIPGEYVIFLMKDGYEEIIDTVSVIEDNVVFHYKMVEETITHTPVVETQEVQIQDEENPFKIQFNDYIIQVTGAKYTQNTLVISFQITNLKPVRELSIMKHSKAYDTAGNEYGPQTIEFANKTWNRNLTHTLVQNIPTKASLIFKNIDVTIEGLTLLKMAFWDQVNHHFEVSFKNIAVTVR